ncbi:MAG: hypothetical protein NTW31_07155 [Bacteroidetes bacterium]|nr:hypothetical protein [Bacteroidota bacterium]
MKQLLSIILISAVIVLTSCGGNAELKKDAKNIAVAMCRNIETMNNLKAVNPGDSLKVIQLRAKEKQAEVEMTVLYQEFKAKYKDKMSDKKFSEDFAKELRKAMLDCPYLSKEDRASFEKDINK